MDRLIGRLIQTYTCIYMYVSIHTHIDIYIHTYRYISIYLSISTCISDQSLTRLASTGLTSEALDVNSAAILRHVSSLHAAGASTDEIGELQLAILVNPAGGSPHGIIIIIVIIILLLIVMILS